MSWNKKSFNNSKNTYHRHKDKFDSRSLDAEDFNPDDWMPYPDKPFYAWNDCPCCPPSAYRTMDDIREWLLKRMLYTLGVNLPNHPDDWF